MKKSNIFVQRDSSSCGVCSIASILSHYGGYVPLEKIREDTLTNKNGTNAYEIVRTLKKYGFNSYGLKTSLDKIDKKLLPLIAHTIKDGYEHFLVIYDFNENYVTTMDPKVGKRVYEKKEFIAIFDNNVIISKPEGEIIKMTRRHTLKNMFKNILKANRRVLFKIIFLNIVIIILSLIVNLFFRIVLEFDSHIYLLMSIFLFLSFLKFFITLFKSFVDSELSISIEKDINQKLITHIFELKQKYLSSKRVGEIAQKINDATNIENLFIKIIFGTSMDILLFLLGIVILFCVSVKLTLLYIPFLSFYIIKTTVSYKKLNRAETHTLDFYNNYYGNLVEYLNGIESIKNLNREPTFLKRIFSTFDRYSKSLYNLNRINIIDSYSNNFIYELGFILTNAFGVLEISAGKLDIASLITFNSILTLLNSSFINILNIFPEIIHIKAIFRELSEFLDVEEENRVLDYYSYFRQIDISNLSYTYDHYRDTIKNVNLTIRRGDKVLISGISGSGKSTFVKCLCGQLDDYSGSIKLNDFDTKNMSINSLREYIVYVGQNEELFNTSIKDNICLGRVDESSYERVVSITNCDEIIEKKREGSDTRILESSSNISGGEKARITLARALFKNTPVLIIDETLSNISRESEDEILNKLLEIEDLTLIYITHRDKMALFKRKIIFSKGECYEIDG